RSQSAQNKAMQPIGIMDVNTNAVIDLIREYGYPEVLLHGHTHRPAIHALTIDGHHSHRWVLGDWHDTAVVCKIDAAGLQLHTLSLVL
ncbi:MAG: UDP-2,3-diacylglucosamine diphosphatase, partial [Methylophilus sp.]|nr:UDP-2,3-diacylglucosamine diphosphatase [Methylophilus sp.]